MSTYRSRTAHAVMFFIVAFSTFSPSHSLRAAAQNQGAGARRPMTFLDMQKMSQAGSPVPSPDGSRMLYTISTPDWKEAKQQIDIYLVSLQQYSMKNGRIYLRAVGDRGGQWRKLGTGFDGDVSIGFWSKDGNTIYFNAGIRATTQLMSLDVQTGVVRQITGEKAALSVSRDVDSGVLIVNYSDGMTPPTLFTAPAIDRIANRVSWIQLTLL